ncbi:protein phosphatase regulator [Fusarium oxysporum]|nr:protein phosphatase regulator [Fusarium oxysporum]KAJ4041445.1 protein phosphatase regulator [Fusarium oxysporum]KAJ4091340.1 protein phosphatase regulator [Fusarium oxysporum]KAJ4092727.1 protein phosphatase regulator [Fusarium oxysporum]KAJ4220269.1 protein phosphatase regulator [Fusarium oxysporum]
MFSSIAQEKSYFHEEIDTDNNRETFSSFRSGSSYTISTEDHATSKLSNGILKPGAPEDSECTKDDMAVSSRPSHQVDYLSHDWREEDIWSSWRYVVMRRGDLSDSERLENAVWRTWIKAKYDLTTISPETLNWLKDHDVTWLYGPLHSVPNPFDTTQNELSEVPLPKTDSHVKLDRKPILKKRSMSEEILQRSLSTASISKQARAACKMQETGDCTHISFLSTEDLYLPFPRGQLNSASSSVTLVTESSGTISPNGERKRTHFNEQVEQCIAVEVEGIHNDDNDPDTGRYGDDSDPDDGVMVKCRKTRTWPLFERDTPESKLAEGKTIAMLPSTTIKNWEDYPEQGGTASKHSRSPFMPSSSEDNHRPAKQTQIFVVEERDQDSVDDARLSPCKSWPPSPAENTTSGIPSWLSSNSLCEEPVGMRITPSGMLMPYEEEEIPSADGILGRIIDTVKTARDIAHVIWTLGWKK